MHGLCDARTVQPQGARRRVPMRCGRRITRVVAAMQDPNPEVAGRGLYRSSKMVGDVSHGLAFRSEAVNLGFLKRMRHRFPLCTAENGASLDGRTAMASGESQWITSAAARADVQRFRAESSAILSTSATVLADNPSLNVRWSELGSDVQAIYPEENLRQPLRIILDSQNRVTPEHQLMKLPGDVLLARLEKDNQLWPESVEQWCVPGRDNRIDLVLLMMQLAKRQINSVWVEAGAQLGGALLQAGLVDD